MQTARRVAPGGPLIGGRHLDTTRDTKSTVKKKLCKGVMATGVAVGADTVPGRSAAGRLRVSKLRVRSKRVQRKEKKQKENKKRQDETKAEMGSSETGQHCRRVDCADERLLPRSVLGPANNCLNLSRRDASLSVITGVPDVFWSAMRATSGMTGGRWGRERCLWRAACSPAASGGSVNRLRVTGAHGQQLGGCRRCGAGSCSHVDAQ
ncbi:hypothetical protein EYF80_019329 [Liparis tanakae]|uniref:Uncharacterized protein n=1 Tax=Liparis tanakae TaxID=230148 RepID=A0A4Z2HZR0_9TELE|nr:hypothetical protein EYF80_019329 [Liparis tanakae]